MRKDEEGNACPATLGEYRAMCAALGGETCEAVRFLDQKILKTGGPTTEVVATDSQMRALLMPMLVREVVGSKQ